MNRYLFFFIPSLITCCAFAGHLPKDVAFNIDIFRTNSHQDLSTLMLINKTFYRSIQQLVASNPIFKSYPDHHDKLLYFKTLVTVLDEKESVMLPRNAASMLPSSYQDLCKTLSIENPKELTYNDMRSCIDYFITLQQILTKAQAPRVVKKIKTLMQMLINEALKEQTEESIVWDAYTYAHENNFQKWFENVIKTDIHHQALFGIVCRSFYELSQEDNGKACFDSCPENILKMMLRFASNGALHDKTIDVKKILDLKTGSLNASEIIPHHGLRFLRDLIEVTATLYREKIKKLDLSLNNLNHFPNFDAFPNLEELDLDRNDLLTLPNFSFIPKLRLLRACENILMEIPNFTNIPNLEVLLLAYNELSDVPDFTNLPKLKELILSTNEFTQKPTFTHLPKDCVIDIEVLS